MLYRRLIDIFCDNEYIKLQLQNTLFLVISRLFPTKLSGMKLGSRYLSKLSRVNMGSSRARAVGIWAPRLPRVHILRWAMLTSFPVSDLKILPKNILDVILIKRLTQQM